MDKASLRKYIKQQGRSFSKEQLAEWSSLLCKRLLSHSRIAAAHTVLLYHSLPDEVQTSELLRTLLNKGKTLLLPKITGDGLMELRIYNGEHDLCVGKYGIKEPTGEAYTYYNNIDVAVIPGVAFDVEGNRLGRGKGYYDRILPLLTSAYKIGLCFSFQIADNIPTETHDMKVDEVLY